jgi:small subunit ribosomal protein S9
MNNQKYYQAVGRRKTATATVRLYPGESGFIVNEKPLEEYFKVKECVIKAKEALEKVNLLENFKVIAKVRGGGYSDQSDAIRLGTARALVL